ncbi:sensor histidine kinase [Dolosigranulum savutiense]|uniref:Sensor histidine kinase n=1 Tax=Dolosigranulum savutiense TaxID=3110288 RepID=A0AB74TVP5_9LACT
MRRQINRFLQLWLIFAVLAVSLVVFAFETFLFDVDGWEMLMYRDMSYLSLPLVVYLLGFTLVLAMLFMIGLTLIERIRMRKIEQSLRALNQGRYNDKVLEKIVAQAKPVYITKQLDSLILQLCEKLTLMSRQVLSSNEEKLMLEEETKEEILEKERHRIARELHDSVSQQLFASSMMLSALNQQTENIPDAIQKQLQTIESITNESQLEMRALLLHLRPVKLNEKTLKQGIEQLLKELSTKVNMAISYEIEDVSLPVSVEDNLFRVIQELLSNVLRHSKASEVEVYLKKTGQQIQLRIIDDGVGFDMKNQKSGNYGLQNIRERINGLGGHVKLISFKQQGTSVEIIIPISIGG